MPDLPRGILTMTNKLFKTISFWTCIAALVLCLANTVITFISEMESGDVFSNLMSHGFETIWYKLSLILIALGLVILFISYFLNNGIVKRIIMAVMLVLQAIGLSYTLFIDNYNGSWRPDRSTVDVMEKMFYIAVIVFCAASLVSLIFWLIDSNHRKDFLRLLVFAAITGAGVFSVFVAIIALALFIVIKIKGGSSGSSSVSSSPAPVKVPSKPQVNESSNASDDLAREFDARYEREYQRITGSSPAWLDFKIIKDGPMNDAVRELRKTMQAEAKSKGIRSKWF